MKFNELAKARYSVRSYADKPVEQEKLEAVLQTAQLAPTAGNYQPQRIYVLKSPEALEKARSVTRFTYGAPAVILFCADTDVAWRNSREPDYNSAEMDVTLVGAHAMLAAAELGLGTVWVRDFDVAKTAEVFALPENIKPIFMLPIGYPSETAAPHKWHDIRKPLEEVVQEL